MSDKRPDHHWDKRPRFTAEPVKDHSGLTINMVDPRPSWHDIEQRARDCPALYQLVRQARATGDQHAAMIQALLWFSDERAKSLEREIERLQNSLQPPILMLPPDH
jgi:hypothetical protein